MRLQKYGITFLSLGFLLLSATQSTLAQPPGGGGSSDPPGGGSGSSGSSPSVHQYPRTSKDGNWNISIKEKAKIKTKTDSPVGATVSTISPFLPFYIGFSLPGQYTNLLDSYIYGSDEPIELEFTWIGQGNPANSVSLIEYRKAMASVNVIGTATVDVATSLTGIPTKITPLASVLTDLATGAQIGYTLGDIKESRRLKIKKNPGNSPLTSFTLQAIPYARATGTVTMVPYQPPSPFPMTIFVPSGNVNGQIGIDYDADTDNRKVHISRIGAVGEWVDENGDTHGDTIWSYDATGAVPPAEPRAYPNWQQFTASRIGDWSTNLSWQWSPQYSGATEGWNAWLIPYGGQSWKFDEWGMNPHFSGKTGGSPSEQIMSYSLTDHQDGAVASKKYYLKMHDPVEELSRSVTTYDKFIGQCSPTYQLTIVGQVIVMTVTITQTWTATASLTGGLGEKWLLDSLGFTVGGSYAYAIAVSGSINTPPATADDIGYSTYLEVWARMKHITGLLNLWDLSGNGAYTQESVNAHVPDQPHLSGYRIHYPYIPPAGGQNGNG